jgi:hypothetical protein
VADAAAGRLVSVVAPARIEREAQRSQERVQAVARPRRWPFVVAVAGTIVAMFAPYLRNGVVLGLDTPVNLVGPYPRTSIALGGVPPELAARAPIDAFLQVVYRALPWGQVRLLPVVAAVALTALGFSRLFPKRPLAAFGATLLFVTNPFIYERVVAGQDFLVLGYCLLPLLLSLVWSDRSGRAVVAIALLCVTLAALSLHLIFIAGVLSGIYLVSDMIDRRWRDARSLLVAALLALVGSLYWIVPAIGSWNRIDVVPVSDLALFRSLPDPRLGLWANLAGLYGFWRRGWPLPKDGLPWWPMFLLAIVVVGGIGVARAMRVPERRRGLRPLLMVGVIGLLLAAGDQGSFGGMYTWAFQHVPTFRIMREPQKWLVLLTLAYAVAFGEGLEACVRAVTSIRSRIAVTGMVLAVAAVYGFSSFWGAGGYVRPSSYPTSWAQADSLMGTGPRLVVGLPWHRYLAVPWAQDRVVSNPMVSAFRRDVVVSADPEFGGMPEEGRDPLASGVGAVLDAGVAGQQVAVELDRLGVRYLVLAKIDDWQDSGWLYHEAGIVEVHRWSDLILFEVVSGGTGRG